MCDIVDSAGERLAGRRGSYITATRAAEKTSCFVTTDYRDDDEALVIISQCCGADRCN